MASEYEMRVRAIELAVAASPTPREVTFYAEEFFKFLRGEQRAVTSADATSQTYAVSVAPQECSSAAL